MENGQQQIEVKREDGAGSDAAPDNRPKPADVAASIQQARAEIYQKSKCGHCQRGKLRIFCNTDKTSPGSWHTAEAAILPIQKHQQYSYAYYCEAARQFMPNIELVAWCDDFQAKKAKAD